MSTRTDSEGTPLTRLFWVVLGPAVLLLLAVGIVQTGDGWLTLKDLAFFIFLAFVVLARWYEFHRGTALTSTGEPAGPAHLRRYVVVAIGIGVGVWGVANLLGNHWLTK